MNILEYIQSLEKYKLIINDLNNNGNYYLGNCAPNVSKILCAITYLKKKQNVIYVTENIYQASKAYEILCDLVEADNVSFFPVEEFISSELVASSISFRFARMLTLFNIVENHPKIIVTCCEGITRCTMSRDKITNATIKINIGDIYNRDKLINDFVIRGYKKVSLTSEMGTFSVRGSIIDIYPINGDSVYRISFFDDEVEAIKKVDIETQMSISKEKSLNVFPLYEMYYDISQLDKIEKKIKMDHYLTEKVSNDLNRILNFNSLDQLYIYLPYIDENYNDLLTLCNNPVCFYENPRDLLSHEHSSKLEIEEYLKSVKFSLKKDVFVKLEDLFTRNILNVFCSSDVSSLNNVKLTKFLNLQTSSCFENNNNLRNVIEEIRLNHDKTYIVTHFDKNKTDFLEDVFKHNNLDFLYNEKVYEKKVNLMCSSNAYGFIDYELRFEIITPHEFASGKISQNQKYSKYNNQITKIYTKDEIKPGDFVINEKYGIGIYRGIETKLLRGNLYDYLVIQYANDGKLLLPVENISQIEKYNVSSGVIPKLNSLDTKEWNKKKNKIKEKVIDVAKRLIKVQAERDLRKGFVYKEDTPDQIEFEHDFEFIETVDQMKAINDVKNDMMSEKPLDRLICGDVGFGKTEVAMRAAFKAIENGKQVAYLAPTTVLTRQHYYTFKERFEKFGVKVELLNRFVSVKKQTQVIKDLSSGYVDIIIGTHRILSSDIKFKDLGLLIIDEEQRFGVTHKEKIKEMKANVDVLTLTATPIPRTLQMSISGLKDMTLIETPPTNRLPIQTYVLESNDSVIREAINRELSRGGQVFYLMNRIDGLDGIVEKIAKLCPHARVGVIHGRMDKISIENELIKFLDNEYDVLVCTTIIETGIDIPNANTLIIERADYLGLSQLYQIRGRVGRSDRIAYAYLMYDKYKVLTDNASKRLEAIKEFTSLGSGYKIAMRDLAIRGAGDFLGEEQSGFIDTIGMDLYAKLLDECINELKGIIKEEDKERLYNLNISKHVDSNYVSDDDVRIDIHKQINKIRSREQIEDLIKEYNDRYGKVSDELVLYMEEKYLEYLLKSRGIETVKEKDGIMFMNFDDDSCRRLDVSELIYSAKTYAPKLFFSFADNKVILKISTNNNSKEHIYTLIKFFENINLK